MCPELIDKIDEGQLDRAWQQAIEILQTSEHQNLSAQRGLAALSLLHKKTADYRGHMTPCEPEQPANRFYTGNRDALDGPTFGSTEAFAIDEPGLLSAFELDWDWLDTLPFVSGDQE